MSSYAVNHRKGFALRVLSTVMLALMMATVQGSCPNCSISQVVLMRGAFALPVVLVYLWWRGGLSDVIGTRQWTGHLARGLLGGTSLILTFIAIRSLPLPLATALTFLAPAFASLGATVLIGERPSIATANAIFFGLVGILCVFLSVDQGSMLDADNLGVLCGVTGAMFMAASMIQLKRLTLTESAGTATFFFSCAIAIFGITASFIQWGSITMSDVAYGALAGALGAGAHLALAESVRHAPLSLVAPVDYLLLIWTLGLNWLLFDKPVGPLALIGATVILLSVSRLRAANGFQVRR